MTQERTQTPWRSLRLVSGLGLREVARRAGIDAGRLSYLERGLTEQEEQRLRRVLAEAMFEKADRVTA